MMVACPVSRGCQQLKLDCGWRGWRGLHEAWGMRSKCGRGLSARLWGGITAGTGGGSKHFCPAIPRGTRPRRAVQTVHVASPAEEWAAFVKAASA